MAINCLPPEITDRTGERRLAGREPGTVGLRAVVKWVGGTVEDVTPLCRFRNNDDAIDDDGLVRCGDSGDNHVVYEDNAMVPIPVLRPIRAGSPADSLAIRSPD